MASIKFLSNVFRRPKDDAAQPTDPAAAAPVLAAEKAAVDTSSASPATSAPSASPDPAGTSRLSAFADGNFTLKSPSGVLVIGWIAEGSGLPVTGSLRIGGTDASIASKWSFRYRREDVARYLNAAAGAPDRYGFVAFFPLDVAPAAERGRIDLVCGTATHAVDVDFSANARFSSESLRIVWELAREELLKALDPFPGELLCALPVEPALPAVKFFVDHCFELPTGHFINGWLTAFEGVEPRVYLVDEEEERAVCLSDQWVRIARPDVVEAQKEFGVVPRFCGFAALAHFRGTSAPKTLALYLCTPHGCMRQPLPVNVPPDWRAAATAVLGAFRMTNPRLATAVADHVGPALEAIAAERYKKDVLPKATVQWFGSPPSKPAASVIVPLWHSADLVRFQLAAFGPPTDTPEWELIFAVDDPALQEPVLSLAEDWLALYGRPFGIATWDRNVGFLRALNIAAGEARGDVLVFMHSDVLAESSDWIGRLLKLLERQPQCGIAGPKLLYEDGTIQCEGVRRRATKRVASFVEPELMHRGLPDRNVGEEPQVVDGISTGCMAIRRALFESLGGFDTGFLLQEDFAELDLCLRAAQAGARTMIDPTLTMRHLESFSNGVFTRTEPFLADPAWLEKVQICNAWRLTHRLARTQTAAA